MGGEVVARAPLTAASYQKCLATLERGQVKRVLQRGPLVGYYLTCPVCSSAFAYLHDKHKFSETAPPVRMLTGVERSPKCFKCGSMLSIESTDVGFDLVARKVDP